MATAASCYAVADGFESHHNGEEEPPFVGPALPHTTRSRDKQTGQHRNKYIHVGI